MEKYNKLTQKLLSEGYTINNYPDYVCIGTSGIADEDLNNFYGGFEYRQWYIREMVYETGCGIITMGEDVICDLHYMGEVWSHENNNPLIRCPYNRKDCPNNDKRLWELWEMEQWCVCHRIEERGIKN